MRIFVVSRGIPSDKEPQWGCFEMDQAVMLKQAGHDVTVLSIDRRFRLFWRKIGITRSFIDGILCFNLFLFPDSILCILGRTFALKANKYLLKIIYKQAVKEKGIPDVIYAHYLPIIQVALVLKNEYGIPVVGMEHWSKVVADPVLPAIQRMAEQTYSKTDCLISVSPFLQNVILSKYGVQSELLNNVFGKEFSYQPQVYSTKQNTQKVSYVAVGSLLPIKHYDMILDSFHLLRIPSDTWELNIIGEGDSRPILENLIKQYGYEDNVHLLGRCTKKRIANVLNQSDVFLLSSKKETFSVVCIEALACGLPVVSTRCGGPEYIINETNGILVPSDDVNAFAEAILKMQTHYKKYDRQQIANNCSLCYGSVETAKRLTDIFIQTINH